MMDIDREMMYLVVYMHHHFDKDLVGMDYELIEKYYID